MTEHYPASDPALSTMTMDLLSQILSRSDNPGEMGRYLSEEIRELTGAKCILVILNSDSVLGSSGQIFSIHPERRRRWAESP